jgi:hypothetical protein
VEQFKTEVGKVIRRDSSGLLFGSAQDDTAAKPFAFFARPPAMVGSCSLSQARSHNAETFQADIVCEKAAQYTIR